MKRIRTLAVAPALMSFIPQAARAADLTVAVKEVRSPKGSVLIAVYDRVAAFGKRQLAKARQMAKAAQGEITVIFHDLPAGKHAVSAFHDENGNGKLDRNAPGVPSEGYGFSDDAQGSAGPSEVRASRLRLRWPGRRGHPFLAQLLACE